MKTIEINLPIELYDTLLEQFGTQKKIEDLFSVKLENKVKREIYLLKVRGFAPVEHKIEKTLKICIKDNLYPYLNEYCIHRSQTKKEVILKMIKKFLSR
jgi:hypothetical protein